MLLLLMRHGIAEAFCAEQADDFHRALTRKGRKRAKCAAIGARKLVPQLDFLASSPKTRARQTAQIAREVWNKKSPPLTEWSELMEDDFAMLFHKLSALNAKIAAQKNSDSTVLLCGHEPLLSCFVSWLLTSSAEALALQWKKAGVCALQIEFAPQKMKAPKPMLLKATLLWHLTPRQLKEIGR